MKVLAITQRGAPQCQFGGQTHTSQQHPLDVSLDASPSPPHPPLPHKYNNLLLHLPVLPSLTPNN